jgi:hypothetical protein
MVAPFWRCIHRKQDTPPYLMKIALTSARIKGLKTYWGVYIGLFEGVLTPDAVMRRIAMIFCRCWFKGKRKISDFNEFE